MPTEGAAALRGPVGAPEEGHRGQVPEDARRIRRALPRRGHGCLWLGTSISRLPRSLSEWAAEVCSRPCATDGPLRAPALPAQRFLGGGFGRGAKPPSESPRAAS